MSGGASVAAPLAHDRPALPVWRAAVGGAVVAAVLALLVRLVAGAVGASMTLTADGKADEIGSGDVIAVALLLPALGIAAAGLLARWKPAFLRVGQLVGGGLALLSCAGPLAGDTDGGTTVALVVMHLLVGVTAMAALGAMRRSRA